MSEIGYYNYYQNPHQFSPNIAQNNYQKMRDRASDELHSKNESSNVDVNILKRQLDEKLSSLAQEVRLQLKSENEIRKFLSKKYFNSEDFSYSKKWEEPEKYAMFENDYNAINFGTIGSGNLNDPRLNYTEEDWQNEEYKESSFKQFFLNSQIDNLFKNSNIPIENDDTLLISINPYNFSTEVQGLKTPELNLQASKTLNQGASKQLLFYAVQNSTSLNHEALTKFRAFQEVKNLTGYNLSDLRLSNDEFITDSGEKLFDILEKNIQNNSSIAQDFKTSAIENVEELINEVAKSNWNTMPDLNLSVTYSTKDGISLLNNIWEA